MMDIDGQAWTGDDDVEYDDEYDDEAEAIARRLGDQLWADIAKAQREAAARPSPARQKQDAALSTMKTILAVAAKDALVHRTLDAATVPAADNASVLAVLTRCVSAASVSKPLARPLSDALVALAKSDALFASLRNSSAPALHLRKRKRTDAHPDPSPDPDPRAPKRQAVIDYPDLELQISEAIRAVAAAFAAPPPPNRPPDPALIAATHHPLHQIFLFAVTSAPRAPSPHHTSALHELAGLIQMLGILTGIPIGSALPPPHAAFPPAPGAPVIPDIATAVYPCLAPSCSKTFHRLYSLRAHQRLHTLVDRPFRCAECPASFSRNHDLKRHVRLHGRRGWRCGGCGKVFSRRDAIKRHKDARAGRGRARGGAEGVEGDAGAGAGAACAYAEVEEVEVDREEGEEEASRRAKLWNGIVASQLAASASASGSGEGLDSAPEEGAGTGMEEGEVPREVVERAQVGVLSLRGVLQVHVTSALGTPPPPHPHSRPYGHHLPPMATLASVMAAPPQVQAQPRAHAQPVPPPPAQEQEQEPSDAHEGANADGGPPTTTTLSWLSEEQTKMLEAAIAQAASAARAQAEAEAALEEEEEEGEEGEEGEEDLGEGEE